MMPERMPDGRHTPADQRPRITGLGPNCVNELAGEQHADGVGELETDHDGGIVQLLIRLIRPKHPRL
jgi:hypothetical protein